MAGDYGMVGAALCCLAMAYLSIHRLRRGWPRLLVVLPVLVALFKIPWRIHHCHLRSILSFAFFWVCPSKLLLLSWDAPIDYPVPGFLYFCTVSLLPIRVSGVKPKHTPPAIKRSSRLRYVCQLISFVAILNLYAYREKLSICVIYALYCLHIYLGVDLIFGGIATLVEVAFAVQCDAPSSNPLLSSSLSEFWGRRWNLVVTKILRPTVYKPVLRWVEGLEKRGPRSTNGPAETGQIIQRHQHGCGICHSSTVFGGSSNWGQGNNLCDISSGINGPLNSYQGICQCNGSIGIDGPSNSDRDLKNSKQDSIHCDGSNTYNGFSTSGLDNRSEGYFNSSMSDISTLGNHSHGCGPNAVVKPSLKARAVAMMATFTVSGLLHELIFICMNNGEYATGEVTAFFIVHGVATFAEVSLGRIVPPQKRLPQPIGHALTMAFLYITAVWLFMPQITRGGADRDTIAEYLQLQQTGVNLIKRIAHR